jgi:hypothetical protein
VINILAFIFTRGWVIVNQLDIHIDKQAVRVNRYRIAKGSVFLFPCDDIGIGINTRSCISEFGKPIPFSKLFSLMVFDCNDDAVVCLFLAVKMIGVRKV